MRRGFNDISSVIKHLEFGQDLCVDRHIRLTLKSYNLQCVKIYVFLSGVIPILMCIHFSFLADLL